MRYLSNRNSDGLTDENGHFRLPLKMLDGEVLSGFEVQPQSTPDMTVTVTAGEAKIPYSDYAYAVWSTEDEILTIPASSSSGNRIDRIVAYVDRTMTFTEEDVNHPGGWSFRVVAGTPSGTPVPATDTQVQSAVGAGNPWIDIAQIAVQMNSTAVTSGNITSTKTGISMSPNVKMPEMTTIDGSSIKFAVINEGEDLPAAIEGSTLVVLVVKR